MKRFLLVSLLAASLAACEKIEPAPPATPDGASETKHDENIVTLTEENLKHITLATEPATAGRLSLTLKAAGRISANLNTTARVAPALEGRVVKLNYDLNDRVKTGDVLALVESPELLGRTLELKAPQDGVIIERNVTAGELVDKSKPVYTISDPSRLWAIAEVKERDIAAVQLGQEAVFTVLAYPDAKFRGQVALIGNQVETGSRTVEVRIVTDNTEGRLKPGMFADVEIVTSTLDPALLIADSAVDTEGENQIVFVALSGNRFEKRIVKTGSEQSGRVQILDGVQAGENVVTKGGFILKSEMLKDQLGEE